MMQRVFRKILWITVCIAGVWPAVDAWAGASGDASTAWVEHLVLGDVDGNGVVDMEDARLVIRFVLGQVDSLPNPGDADATQDGEITLEDALAIAQSVTGISRVVVAGPVHGLPGKAQVRIAGTHRGLREIFPLQGLRGDRTHHLVEHRLRLRRPAPDLRTNRAFAVLPLGYERPHPCF